MGAPCGGSSPKAAVGRVREAGKAGQRCGRNELRFAAELHGADDGGQVHVAAALAGSDERALDMDCAGQNGGAGVGDAETAIGVTVKSEMRAGKIADEAAMTLRDFFGA